MKVIQVWVDDGSTGDYCFTTDFDVCEGEPNRNWKQVDISTEQLDQWFAVNTLQWAQQNEMARFRGDKAPIPEEMFE